MQVYFLMIYECSATVLSTCWYILKFSFGMTVCGSTYVFDVGSRRALVHVPRCYECSPVCRWAVDQRVQALQVALKTLDAETKALQQQLIEAKEQALYEVRVCGSCH